MRNQTKLWKTKTGPFQGDKAWSGDPKSKLFEIIQDKDRFTNFEPYLVVELWLS